MTTSADAPPRYPGPRPPGSGLTQLLLCEGAGAAFTRDGPRADVEYRDLGWAKASAARSARSTFARSTVRCGDRLALARHDGPFRLRPQGLDRVSLRGRRGRGVVVRAGSSLSQPAGVAHNVVGRSDDLELIEINLPAEFGVWDIAGPEPGSPR